MVDKALLSRKISKLLNYISELKLAKDITWERYKTNKREKAFVERYIHLAIEEVFDIAGHIVSYHKWREPENYRDVFAVLVENKILNSKDLKAFQNMASFRNILVHQYEKIDDEIVYGIFKKKLGDFMKFTSSIETFFLKIKKNK
jgi:uncharacterized protein YutE (UPF0331/DUF86 family)|tara:strand:- start:299 stop:733 length:435 start_codon:yes stop_codon:yes gene_type:complete